MTEQITFRFEATLWEHDGDAPWVFATLPTDEGEAIRSVVPSRPGFGSVRVRAVLGHSAWETSVFPDTESGSFLLPVKKAIRDAEGVEPGDTCDITVSIGL